jgi:hypothetical protein
LWDWEFDSATSTTSSSWNKWKARRSTHSRLKSRVRSGGEPEDDFSLPGEDSMAGNVEYWSAGVLG